MKDVPNDYFEWNIEALHEPSDLHYLRIGREIQEITRLLAEFREKHLGSLAQTNSVNSCSLDAIRDAENLLGRAYTLQLVIQIVTIARDDSSSALSQFGQEATDLYLSALSAVEGPLLCIDLSSLMAKHPELESYQPFLSSISSAGPHPRSSRVVSSSNSDNSSFAAWSEYCGLRRSIRLKIPTLSAEPLNRSEVFRIMERGQREPQMEAFNAYSGWLAEKEGIFCDLYSQLVESAIQERALLRCQPWRSYSMRESIVPPIYTELLHDDECLSLFQQFERLRLDVKTDEEVPIVVKCGSGISDDDVFAAADVRALVLAAFGALSQNAADVVAHLFDSGRVFTNPHRSPDRGVNCVGVPGLGPFVSVPMSRCSAPLITRLAHEMGHAFQKTLAGKCSYFCHGIERLLSEAIATFFELWTLNFMLEGPLCARLSRGGRLGLLATLFEDLYERTALAVYERDVFELSVQKRIEPRELSQAWSAAHQPLLSGVCTLPPEFDLWWADHSMLFRYPLAQSYYPAATVMGLALYFRAKTNPGGFMEDFEKRLILGGTLEFSAWEDLFGIGLKMPHLPQMVSRFVGKSLDGLALGGWTLGI